METLGRALKMWNSPAIRGHIIPRRGLVCFSVGFNLFVSFIKDQHSILCFADKR